MRVVLSAVLCLAATGALAGCSSMSKAGARPLAESADHLVVCDGRSDQPPECARRGGFNANFTPLTLAEPRQVAEPSAMDAEAFRKMVEEMDRQVAPCHVLWSGTGHPHPIDISCPQPQQAPAHTD